MAEDHLRLAGVTRLSVQGRRGAIDAFVFDPHRLAFPSWAMCVGDGKPALLVTLDRHFDLVPPVAEAPPKSAGLRALDEFARWSLDVRNYDHVLSAMEAGIVSDAVVIARATPKGAMPFSPATDRRGVQHRLAVVPTVDRIAERWGSSDPTEAEKLIRGADRVLLDLDLDCFTTLSDADPMTVVPWPLPLIRDFMMPNEPLWDEVLRKCIGFTFAREPFHSGGLVASNALFA
ncbi:MAG: hypothetical protein ACJ790_10870, partial [Myxococcaceae bacterium]